MYCRVLDVLRWPAKLASRCSSQPPRARSVRHRCRSVWVEKRGTSACWASRRTTIDQVQRLIGCPRLRRDSDAHHILACLPEADAGEVGRHVGREVAAGYEDTSDTAAGNLMVNVEPR